MFKITILITALNQFIICIAIPSFHSIPLTMKKEKLVFILHSLLYETFARIILILTLDMID